MVVLRKALVEIEERQKELASKKAIIASVAKKASTSKRIESIRQKQVEKAIS